MGNEINFSNLVIAAVEPGRVQGKQVTLPRVHFELAAEDGTIAVEGSDAYGKSLKAVNELIRDTYAGSDIDQHKAMGAAVREPIRQLVRYDKWTDMFFEEWPLEPDADNRIPLDQPIGIAFASSPEGKPQMVTQGVQQWTRPSFYETSAGMRIHWATMRTAGWPVLKRRMEEMADEMARKADTRAIYHLHAAAAAVAGHVSTLTGGLLTKAGLDALIKSAAQTFPITQGAINPGRIMDMTGWTNGSSTALPFFWAPGAANESVYRNLFAEGYGNIRWRISKSVPLNSIYLSGDPAETGYHQTHGPAQSASAVDIELRVDKHVVWFEEALYVGNNYNVYQIEVTA